MTSKLIRRLIPYAALIAVIFLIASFIVPKQLGMERFVDFSKPETSIKKRTDTLFVSATDNLSGISKIQLQLYQQDKLITEKLLLKENRDRKTEYFNIPLISFAREAKEGVARIVITTTDDSVFGNTTQTETDVTFDFTPPELLIRSAQYRMFAGGAELVIVEASDNNSLQTVYLQVEPTGNRFYPVHLAEADARFQDTPNLYAILFAVERGFLEKNFKPIVTAVDGTGNTTSTGLHIRFVEKPRIPSKPVLSEKFLEEKIPPLIEQMKIKRLIEQNAKLFPEDAFSQVNETYRRDLGLKLSKLLAEQKPRNVIPEGPFIRSMAGRLTSHFGEHRTYIFKHRPISESTHDGQDIASIRRDVVVATAAGKVLLAQSFGIYGNAVVIDHGLGVSSLYGHLSHIDVAVGQLVHKGEKIATSGETGLAGGDHLHFEIRVNNVPVTPIEWWDKKWYDDNIVKKLSGLKN